MARVRERVCLQESCWDDGAAPTFLLMFSLQKTPCTSALRSDRDHPERVLPSCCVGSTRFSVSLTEAFSTSACMTRALIAGCGGVLTTPEGTFSSPDFPEPVTQRRHCRWNIQAPEGRRISLRFTAGDLSDCTGVVMVLASILARWN